MERKDIERTLAAEGFTCSHRTDKLAEYVKGRESVYLKLLSGTHLLIIHGRYAPRICALSALNGVVRKKPVTEAYHNSNMRHFELRQNTGKKPTRYGFDFDFTSEIGLRSLLSAL